MKRVEYFKSIIAGAIVMVAAIVPFLLGKCSLGQLSPISVCIYGTLAAVMYGFSEKQKDKRTISRRITAGIIAFLFSQFIILGQCYRLTNNFEVCFSTGSYFLIWAIQSTVYGSLFYKVLIGLISIVDRQNITDSETHINIKKLLIVIVSFRLLYFIAFYPCVFGFDAAVGLRTMMDPLCATCSHHPYFIQLIHGLFFVIGQQIGHLSVGFALLSLLLIAASAAILVYAMKLFEKAQIKRRWIIATILLYSILPIFPYLSVYPTKDGIFAYSFLLYLLTLYELHITKGQCFHKTRFLILHFVAGLLICLSRHQGSIIFILEFVTLLLAYRQEWKRILTCSLPVIVLYLTFTKVITPLNDVEPAGKQESYGPLFQQTAYCLKRFPNDITQEERAGINAVLNCDTIAQKYDAYKTDAVKNTYKYNPWYRIAPNTPSMFRHIDRNGEPEDLKAYRKAWFSMFMRHPLTHIEASAAIFWGFFYNNGQPLILTEPKWAENPSATTAEYRFWHVSKVADWVKRNNKTITQTPIISWFGAVPYYNWVAIFLLAMLFYRKDWRGIALFLPVILSVGVLLICPVAFGRYIFPIVITLPLLFIYLLSSNPRQCQE